MTPLFSQIAPLIKQASQVAARMSGAVLNTQGTMFDPNQTQAQANQRMLNTVDRISPMGAGGAIEKVGAAELAPVAKSALSYITNAGEKVFTKLAPHELDILKNEVKYIPQALKGASQIHLDPLNSRLGAVAREVSRPEFIQGHPQAGQVFKNTLQQPRDMYGKYYFK